MVTGAFAQDNNSVQDTNSFDIPQVFMIGEYSEYYADLSLDHPDILLSVFQNDMDFAFEKWAGMLVEMEHYSEEIEYDIKGLKIWFNIYFNPDGTIKYLAFFPKPNSRNIPVEELTAFFKNFAKVYKMNVTTENGFQHSASAAFPTFFSQINTETVRRNDD